MDEGENENETPKPLSTSAARAKDKSYFVHLDIDCFYAQAEINRRGLERTEAVAVRQKNLVVTCNYVARARGVKKLMRLVDAQQIYPDLKVYNGENLSPYRHVAAQIFARLKEFTPKLERLGLDEVFVDVTELVKDDKVFASIVGGMASTTEPMGHVQKASEDEADDTLHRYLIRSSIVAHKLRQAVRELGYTTSAGVGVSKMAAKMAGEIHKPDQQTTMYPHAFVKHLDDLPCRKLPGCGYRTSKQLLASGIETVAQLKKFPLPILTKMFGERMGDFLYNSSRGVDQSQLSPSGPPKVMSEEDAVPGLSTWDDLILAYSRLIDDLAKRISDDADVLERFPRIIKVGIRQKGEGRKTRQLPFPMDAHDWRLSDDNTIVDTLLDVVRKTVEPILSKSFCITLISVGVGNFEPFNSQARLGRQAHLENWVKPGQNQSPVKETGRLSPSVVTQATQRGNNFSPGRIPGSGYRRERSPDGDKLPLGGSKGKGVLPTVAKRERPMIPTAWLSACDVCGRWVIKEDMLVHLSFHRAEKILSGQRLDIEDNNSTGGRTSRKITSSSEDVSS